MRRVPAQVGSQEEKGDPLALAAGDERSFSTQAEFDLELAIERGRIMLDKLLEEMQGLLAKHEEHDTGTTEPGTNTP